MVNTNFPIYPLIIVISIFTGLILTYRRTLNTSFTKEERIGFVAFILFGLFSTTFISKIYDGGFSSFGGLIGIIIMIVIFKILFKKKLSELLAIIIPVIPLMYAIGKIGCFIVGCCYGIPYNGPFAIVYNYSKAAPKGESLFPIQIVESIVFLVIYLFISYLEKRSNKNVVSYTFILCGLAKFLLDYLRSFHIGKIITANQVLSLAFIILGIIILIKNKIKKPIKKES